MATTKLMPLHLGKGRTVGTAISKVIDYVENPQKTDNGKLITSCQWEIDKEAEQGHEDQIARETHALSKRTGDQ